MTYQEPSNGALIYAYRLDVESHGWYGGMINTLGNFIGFMGTTPHVSEYNRKLIRLPGAIPCCIFCPNPYKPVAQGNVGLITKFGRFYRAVDPGLVKSMPRPSGDSIDIAADGLLS